MPFPPQRFCRARLCHTLVVGFLAAVLVAGAAGPARAADADAQEALAELDALYDSCFAWWGAIYDPASGGFFYSLSARRGEAYHPDIEATCKAVKVLAWTGVLDEAPPAFREGVVRYMQARQDAASGFFLDPQFRDQYTFHRRHRALGMATDVLQACGAAPLHPLPKAQADTNAQAAADYAHLASPEALLAWLKDLPWERRTWTSGARILGLGSDIRGRDEPLRARMAGTMRTFLLARQGEDGFWRAEGEHWRASLSGTYKICAGFEKLGLPIPKSEALAETVLGLLETKTYDNVIVVYNTANLLGILHRNGTPLNAGLRLKIVRRCTRQLARFQAEDGGFLTQRDRPAPVQNGFRMSDPVLEANTNATGLAHKTRMLLHQLLTGQAAPHPHPRAADLIRAPKAAAE